MVAIVATLTRNVFSRVFLVFPLDPLLAPAPITAGKHPLPSLPSPLPLQEPLFHDGTKEWGCCKKKSYDFGDFMSLPGCVTGKHTSEKPAPVVATKAAAPPSPPVASAILASKSKCARCSQGFFCADHAPLPAQSSTLATCQSQGRTPAVSAKPPASVGAAAPTTATPDQPKLKDVRAEQVCARKGCGARFSEMMNSATACKYHPGPPLFHDRSKGWSCCDIHVKEFDEFMAIPPCTTGWHSA